MKKRLLLAALALVSTVGTFAFNVGDYVYTATQRVKIAGENLVANGNFKDGLTVGGWCSSASDGVISTSSWTVKPGEGPNGEDVAESLGATAGEDLCNVWSGLTGGQMYVVSFQIKGEGAASTSVGTTVNNNYADFFLNSDGSLTHVASTEEAPVKDVAIASSFGEEWKTIAFTFTPDEGQSLVMHFEKMATGTKITNFALHQATLVYDDRIVKAKVDFAEKILADPNFNETDEAKAARDEFENGAYAYIKAGLEGDPEGANFDDPGEAESTLEQFDLALTAFMDASSCRLNSLLKGTDTSDLTAVGKINRGDNNALNKNFPDLELTGGNWQHAANGDYIYTLIQGNYANSGTYNAVSKYIPAGKYFFTAEIRNSYVDSKYNNTYTLETTCKFFVGKDTIEVGPIVGEDYQKFYLVGNIEEDGSFRVGIEWPGHTAGSAFYVKNVEIRGFVPEEEIVAKVNHLKAFEKYIAQWNAATGARNGMVALLDNPNYPWGQPTVKEAWEKWDAFYFGQKAKGWTTEDGADAGVATTEELEDWALYQGVEEYDVTVNEETGEETQTRKQYQVVRGYQNTTSAVKALNKPFFDLAEAIEAAKAERNKGVNQTGNRDAYKTAIEKAITTIKEIRQTTTDDSRVADSTRIESAIAELKAASEAFAASVQGSVDLVDIDFSNDFEKVTTQIEGEDVESYVIKGTLGEMAFPLTAVDTEHGDGTDDGTTAGTKWSLGYGENFQDVLRIGSIKATVEIPGEVSETDVIRVSFDFWGGYLNKCYTAFELQNAAGEMLAQVIRYNSNGTSSSTFGVDAADIDKYITVTGSSKQQNDAIYSGGKRSSIAMELDYLNKTQKLTLVHESAGTLEGTPVEMTTPTSGDTKVAKLVIYSNYSSQKNSARRSWLDNIKITKQIAGIDQEEDIAESPYAEVSTGIANMNTTKVANNAIYNMMGVKVQGTPAKGLYIMNGKKFIIK